MIVVDFISQEIKQALRASVWQKNALINFFLLFAVGTMLVYMLLLGLYLDKILMAIFPHQNPVHILNGFLLYYFLVDLISRFFFQEMPVMSAIPYLHLPIKKSKIANYILAKSALSFFNVLPLLIFIPFSIKIIMRYESLFGGFAWIFSLFAITIVVNYTVLFLKKQFIEKPAFLILLLAAIAALFALEYYQLIHLRNLSSLLFDAVVYTRYAFLLPLLLLVAFFAMAHSFLKKKLNLEGLGGFRSKEEVKTGNFSFLDRFGKIGELMALELKLIFRNKRSRSVAFLSLLFVFYGLIFYPSGQLQNVALFILVGIFVSGMFIINYGQFTYSWESGYFDFLLTQNISIRNYIESKFFLYGFTAIAFFLLSIPYAYFGWKIVLINFCMMLFNVGVTSFTTMLLCTLGPKRIDLSKGTTLNYEGVGAAQFILIIPIMGLPFLIFLPFMAFGNEMHGVYVLGILGLVNILLHKWWIKIVSRRVQFKKHAMALSLREK
jgi:hypothetical protein